LTHTQLTCKLIETEASKIVLNVYIHYIHTLLLTLCGLTSQKTHLGSLGLGGLVHEEAHPCFPYSV